MMHRVKSPMVTSSSSQADGGRWPETLRSRGFPLAVGELGSDPQLRSCDGRDRYVVVVIDDLVKVLPGPLRVDEEGGVEEEPRRDRLSISRSARTSSSSFAQFGSGWCRRSSALTSAPRPSCVSARDEQWPYPGGRW
jgi:hypothetical protein